MRTEACVATKVRGEQSEQAMHLTMACLDRALHDLEATTGVLASADVTVAGRSDALLGRLPDLGACADVVALDGKAPPPAAADAAAVDSARQALADAWAASVAGRFKDARADVETARGALDGVDYTAGAHRASPRRGSCAAPVRRVRRRGVGGYPGVGARARARRFGVGPARGPALAATRRRRPGAQHGGAAALPDDGGEAGATRAVGPSRTFRGAGFGTRRRGGTRRLRTGSATSSAPVDDRARAQRPDDRAVPRTAGRDAVGPRQTERGRA